MKNFKTSLIAVGIALILCAVVPWVAFGSPHLISDPSPDGAEVWQLEIDGAVTEMYEGAVINYDLVDISPGLHLIRGRYGIGWVADGEMVIEWSEWSADFPLERPERPSAPINQRIVP